MKKRYHYDNKEFRIGPITNFVFIINHENLNFYQPITGPEWLKIEEIF